MCMSDDLSLVIILTQYLQVVFEPITNVLYWCHRGFRIVNPVFSCLQWYSFKYVRTVQFFFSQSERGSIEIFEGHCAFSDYIEFERYLPVPICLPSRFHL